MTIEQKAEKYVESRGKELFRKFYDKQLSMADLMKACCIEFASENGVRWHDLLENPNDLPKKDYEVIIKCEGEEEATWKYFAAEGFPLKTIVWCEKPRFEG